MNWRVVTFGFIFGYIFLLSGCQSQERTSAVVEISKLGNSFIGKVHVGGVPTEIKLKSPESNIFAPDFRLIEPAATIDGKLYFNDITPSPDFMDEVERSLYVDQDVGAVFKVHHAEGEYRLHGMLNNNLHISHDGQQHFAVVHNHDVKKGKSISNSKYSYYHKGDPLKMDDATAILQKAVTVASPEVFCVIDFALSEHLNFDNATIIDYIAVLFTAVNTRYATSKDPSIKFKLTGSLFINNRTLQPFIENAAIEDDPGSYDIAFTLDEYSKFIYDIQNQPNVAKHDVAPLITGQDADWKFELSDGSYGGAVGMAHINGACLYYETTVVKMTLKASVNQDSKGFWYGFDTDTVSHELAHNLGAVHDEDEGASDCPQSDGFIMSSDGGGTLNKFSFSTCSRALMKKFIEGAGSCVKVNNASSSWPASTQQTGDRYNLTVECQKLLDRTDADVAEYTNGNDICRNLQCKYPDYCPEPNENQICIWTEAMDWYPYDNAPCNISKKKVGRCKNGYCVQ